MSGDEKTIKILFFGDLVGRPGRIAVRNYLEKISTSPEKPDFVMANVENASHGFGLTEKNYKELSAYGIDCMTSGNHIWDKKDIFTYIEDADRLLRPLNYPKSAPGVGSRVFECNGFKVGAINILGRVFMNLVDDPFEIVKNEIKRLKEITPIVVIDFHAEATAEKICLGRLCAELGVSAFFGTHTHIQTADECIVKNAGYITDVGFCGASDGVIGMDYNTSLSRFLTGIPERYEVAQDDVVQVNAVEVVIDPLTGHALAIKRILCCSTRDGEAVATENRFDSRKIIEEDESQ